MRICIQSAFEKTRYARAKMMADKNIHPTAFEDENDFWIAEVRDAAATPPGEQKN